MKSFIFAGMLLLSTSALCQIDEDQLGAWYSWFYNRNISDSPWATQMIIQQRNWDLDKDLQQRMVLGMVSYKPENHSLRYGLGYYHLRHGAFGPTDQGRDEHVLFQQGLATQLLGERNYMTYRLRLEQHWLDDSDDFRRLRTYISLNRPLNQPSLDDGAIYLSLYDEYFIDLDNVGFALNRIYAGLGYKMTQNTSWQFGVMRQKTHNWSKNQLMLNLFHHY